MANKSDKKESKQDKIKRLVKQRHPNAFLVENASIGWKLDTYEYGAFLEEGLVIYTLNEGETGLSRVGYITWNEKCTGVVDHFAMKSIFEIGHSVFTVGGNGKKFQSYLSNLKEIQFTVKDRKWHEKITGFRSGVLWKKIVASGVYLLLLLMLCNIFMPAEFKPYLFGGSLLTLGLGSMLAVIAFSKKKSLKVSTIMLSTALLLFLINIAVPTTNTNLAEQSSAIENNNAIETEGVKQENQTTVTNETANKNLDSKQDEPKDQETSEVNANETIKEEKKEVAKTPTTKPNSSNESNTPKLKYNPAGPDRDCGDFDTHFQAQAFYEAAGGPSIDPHRLDGSDNDGLVCESLS